jgi:transposase InsO family protein
MGRDGIHLLQVRLDGIRSKKLGVSLLRSSEAEESWRTFLHDHLRVYGFPRVVQTDQGTEFEGQFAKGLKSFGIIQRLSPVGHSQSNPVERMIRELWQALRAELDERGLPHTAWVDILPIVVDKINKRSDTANNVSAFEDINKCPPLFHGMSLLTSFLDAVPTPEVDSHRTSPMPQYAVGEKVLFLHPDLSFGHAARQC